MASEKLYQNTLKLKSQNNSVNGCRNVSKSLYAGHQQTTTTSQLTHQFCAPSLGEREDSNMSQ